MCSETFLRLPEEKKHRFLEAAWEEFSRVPLMEASINKIVLRARIPRGSFYQYFADKKDLFSYLVQSIMDHCLDEYNKILVQEKGNIFRTQMRCFDLVLLEKDPDPLFERGMEILHRNPVMLLQAINENQMAHCVWEATKENVDLSLFRNQTLEVVEQAFVMSLLALVFAMGDALARPEQVEQCRKELLTRIDVLKYGSLEKLSV